MRPAQLNDMTRSEFEKQVKPTIKHGFDGLDGNDAWQEFKNLLTELLDSEKARHALVAGNISCEFGDKHGHCECGFQAKRAIENENAH